MMMFELCAVCECGCSLASLCCCGVSVGVSDGCKEEKGKEGGRAIKYLWVNVVVLWYCVMVSPKL